MKGPCSFQNVSLDTGACWALAGWLKSLLFPISHSNPTPLMN